MDCLRGDFAPPALECRDQTYSIFEDKTLTLNPLNFLLWADDECDSDLDYQLSQSSIACTDAGVSTVTLSGSDDGGNIGSCTAQLTVQLISNVYESAPGNCESYDAVVTAPDDWITIRSTTGQLLAAVRTNNRDAKTARATIYREANRVNGMGAETKLSRRVQLDLLDDNNNIISNFTDDIDVRLYYGNADVTALLAASPVVTNAEDMVVVKSDDVACTGIYKGLNAVEMSTQSQPLTCADGSRIYEFSTPSFSTFDLFATNAILPVELSAFDARALTKDRVELTWTTESETDHNYFAIQRSFNGQDFETIDRVRTPLRTEGQRRHYRYLDLDPRPGENYYRLRQVDYDGGAELSAVHRVSLSGTVVAYPNPADAEIRLAGHGGGAVQLYDVNGRVVRQTVLEAGEPLNIRDLATGVYWLKTADGAPIRVMVR